MITGSSALVVKGLSRLPVTEEIAGSNPVERAKKKHHRTMMFFYLRQMLLGSIFYRPPINYIPPRLDIVRSDVLII